MKCIVTPCSSVVGNRRFGEHDHRFPVIIIIIIIIIIISSTSTSGVRLSPLRTAATSGLLYQPQMIGEGDCGATGGMKIGRHLFVGTEENNGKPPG
jgi:hypothetical protein